MNLRLRLRARALTCLLAAGVVVAGLAGAGNAVAGTFQTGFIATESGDPLASDNMPTRSFWMRRAKQAGSKLVRINVPWRSVAPDVRPANPADPAVYDLAKTAGTVASARAAGMEPILMPYVAPLWAEDGAEPDWLTQTGTWQIRPADFAAFGRALATRFNGVNGPRVKYFQAWVEPNLTLYLAPQWKNGKEIVSADHYKKMLNAFYGAVNSINRSNKVLTAGTAPFGETLGKSGPRKKSTGSRTKPLAFWRDFLCLNKKLKKQGKCAKAKFDILAHHPINIAHKPSWKPASNDDLVPSNLGQLTRALRAAERQNTVAGGKHPLWVDEIWLETNPPDRKFGIPQRKHAAYLAETMYLIAKAGGSTALNLQIQDSPTTSGQPHYFNVQSGLWYAQNYRKGARKKYAFQAFRFPFWAERKSKKNVNVWGRAPKSGRVQIQVKKGGGYKTVVSRKVGASKTFGANLRLKGKGSVRAKLGGETALAVKVGKK